MNIRSGERKRERGEKGGNTSVSRQKRVVWDLLRLIMLTCTQERREKRRERDGDLKKKRVRGRTFRTVKSVSRSSIFVFGENVGQFSSACLCSR